MDTRKDTKFLKREKVSSTPIFVCSCLIGFGIFLTLLVPLVVKADLYYPFASTKGLWFMGAVQFTFAAWVYLVLIDRRYRPHSNLILLTLAAFLLSAAISALFGADPTISFWSKHERYAGVLIQIHLFAFFLILSSFLKREEDWQMVFACSVGIASLVSVWGLAKNYGIDPILSAFDALHIVSDEVKEISEGGSTLGNTSFMGSYLQLNAFFAIYLAIVNSGRLRIAAIVALILICCGIMFNPGGRAMRFSLMVGVAIIALLYLAFGSRPGRVRLIARLLLSAAIPSAVYVSIAAFVGGSFVNERILAIRGMEQRIASWRIAWEGIRERPLLGWGFENYEMVFYRYFDPSVLVGAGRSVQQSWYDRAHNLVFDHLVTIGIVGTSVFFGLIAVSIRAFWREYFRDGRRSFAACAVFTSLLAAHLLQGLSVFEMLASQMLVFVVLAYASSKSDPVKVAQGKISERELGSTRLVMTFIIVLIVFIVPFYHCVHRPYRASILIAAIARERTGGPILDRYVEASEISPVGRHQVRIQLADSVIKRLESESGSSDLNASISEANYVVEQLEKSAEESPLYFRIPYTLGQLNATVGFQLASKGEGEDNGEGGESLKYILAAERAFQEAIDLSPRNVLGYWGLARALIYKGFVLKDPGLHEAALKIAEEAVMIEPRLFASHDLVVNIAENLIKNRALALDKIVQAKLIDEKWEAKLKAHIRSGQPGRGF